MKRSKYMDLYLGYSYDPTPVFRDTQPKAHDWPEGAVFAVTVKEIDLMSKGIRFHRCMEMTEFFGADGWPLTFPADKKDAFFDRNPSMFADQKAEFYRGLFQRYPLTFWRNWSEDDWQEVRTFYQRRMCNSIDWMTEKQFYAWRRHVQEEPLARRQDVAHMKHTERSEPTSLPEINCFWPFNFFGWLTLRSILND